ncbi:MAG: hypothetical protein ACI9MR_001417 [Myxococcota bacterium]|jgi:hypothetical protein
MNRVLRSLTLMAILSGVGTSASDASAQESTLGSFELTGDVRFGTGECNGNPAELRELAAGNVTIRMTDTAFGLRTPAAVEASAVDETVSYSATLQRDVGGTLLDWRHESFVLGQAPLFLFGAAGGAGNSRRFYGLPDPYIPVPSPPVGTNTAVADISITNLSSMVITVDMPWATDADDILVLTIRGSESPGGVLAQSSWFLSGNCAGGDPLRVGCGAVGGATARTAEGFIQRYVDDGAGTIIGQQLDAELLVRPGKSWNGSIDVRLRDGTVLRGTPFTLPDTLFTECGQVSVSTAAGNCPGCSLLLPPLTIQTSLHFDRPTGVTDGARPTAYRSFFNAAGSGLITGFTPGGGILTDQVPVGDELIPFLKNWRGLPAERVRMTDITSGNLPPAGFVDWANVLLDWGTPADAAYRPQWPHQYLPAAYAWPWVGVLYVPDGASGFVPGDQPGVGPYEDGWFYLNDTPGDPNEDVGGVESLAYYAEMRYLKGEVDFAGCNLTQSWIAYGTAELEGVGDAAGPTTYVDEVGITQPIPTGNYGGFARGLFRAGSHVDAGQYQVVASSGEWQELGFRLGLSDAGDEYKGDLRVWPATGNIYDLSAVTTAATPRTLAVSKVSVTLNVPAGQLVRNPVLSIGQDYLNGTVYPGRVPYFDNAGVQQLGAYTATSQPFAADPNPTDSVVGVIIAMANSSVDIVASAEVSSDGGASWVQTAFPPVPTTDLNDACGKCVRDGEDDLVDDGAPPIVSLDSISDQPVGTTQVVVTGSMTDTTPITRVEVNGIDVPLCPAVPGCFTQAEIPDGNGGILFEATFSMPVAAVAGTNDVEVLGRDCVGNNTDGQGLNFFVIEPLCEEAVTPTECLPDPGGMVFYVGVVQDGTPGAIRCVGLPGQPPTCDINTLLAPQCGN